jgi:hypothetical protein
MKWWTRHQIRGWNVDRWHIWFAPPWRWFVRFNERFEYWDRTVIGPFYILRSRDEPVDEDEEGLMEP